MSIATRSKQCIGSILLISITLVSVGCRKKSDKRKSAKTQHEEEIQQSSNEQAALDQFVSSVREVLVWFQEQPVTSDAERQQAVKVLVQKMQQVPVKGLSDDLMTAWDEMLKVWQALAIMTTPDALLREQGAKAADALNHKLTAHGVAGIRF